MGNQAATFIVMALLLLVDITNQKRYTKVVRDGVEGVAGNRSLINRLNPNYLTGSGVLLCLASALVLLLKHTSEAWVVLVLLGFFVGSMLDVFDGTVARRADKVTPWGTFIDSNTDRLGEGAMMLIFAVLTAREHNTWAMAAAVVALMGSYQVSYARSTAAAIGLQGENPDSGLARRAERCTAILLALAWMAAGWPWQDWIYLLAVLCWITVLQRWRVARQESKKQSPRAVR